MPFRYFYSIILGLAFFNSSAFGFQKQENPPTAEQAENWTRLIKEEDTPDSVKTQLYLQLINFYESSEEYETMARQAIDFFHYPTFLDSSNWVKKSFLEKALSYRNQIEDSLLLGNLELKIAGAWFNLQEFDSAISHYTRALEHLDENDSLYIADTYFFRGQAEDYQGNMLEAMQDYQIARDIYESQGDEDFANYTKGGMAILFSKYGIYEPAQGIREELVEFYKTREIEGDLGVQLYNMAETYRKMGEENLQLQKLKELEALIPFEPEDFYLEAMTYFSLSRHFGEKNELESQREYFQKGEEVKDKVPQNWNENGAYLITKGLLEIKSGNLAQGKAIAQRLLELSASKENMDHRIGALELLEEAYEKSGQTDEALNALRQLTSYKDSIFEANQATSFAYYQTLYETEKKEREILRKNLELEDLQTESRFRIQVFLGVILILIVGGIIFFLSLNLKNTRKAKKIQEEFSQELLKIQEEERKRISKDLHDGLGQSLLLIKNKVALNQPENAGEMLDTAISELRSIARSLHPMQLEKLGLAQALIHLLDQIDSETDIFVSHEIDPLSKTLDKNVELQLYRIAQESINNILKHSEAKAMRVLLVQRENHIELSIEDNGKGFDFSEKYQDFHSLGLKTLKERTASIKGTMKVNSEKGKGTKLSFLIYG
jgi:signal transduction histidine kinase